MASGDNQYVCVSIRVLTLVCINTQNLTYQYVCVSIQGFCVLIHDDVLIRIFVYQYVAYQYVKVCIETNGYQHDDLCINTA